MQHKKSFERPDGTVVFIWVEVEAWPNSGFCWREKVMYQEPGKSYQVGIIDRKYKHNEVTKPEILETKLELWNKIKPTL